MPDYPILESIMEAAYEKYPEKGPFLPTLSPRERNVVALGNLNYQVENGGFHQWVSNGYCSRMAVETLNEFLTKLGTPEALEVLGMVNKVADCVDLDATNMGFCGDYWTDEPDYDEEDEEWGYDPEQERINNLNSLDNRFYEINDALMQAAEDHYAALNQRIKTFRYLVIKVEFEVDQGIDCDAIDYELSQVDYNVELDSDFDGEIVDTDLKEIMREHPHGGAPAPI